MVSSNQSFQLPVSNKITHAPSNDNNLEKSNFSSSLLLPPNEFSHSTKKSPYQSFLRMTPEKRQFTQAFENKIATRKHPRQTLNPQISSNPPQFTKPVPKSFPIQKEIGNSKGVHNSDHSHINSSFNNGADPNLKNKNVVCSSDICIDKIIRSLSIIGDGKYNILNTLI